jgi:diguanylate cyclase (GGDEF)-like protein/PAS domain S-box-containing protein
MQDNHATRVLIIEDNPDDVFLLLENLAHAGTTFTNIELAGSLSEGLKYLSEKDVDLVLLDLSLPDSRGLDTFQKINNQAPDVPFIILAEPDIEDIAANAVRNGARDYLIKGEADGDLLARSIRYAIESNKTTKALRQTNQWYHEIFNRSMTPILIIDINNNFLDCNEAAVQFFECPRHELLAKNISDYMDPGYGETIREYVPLWEGGKTFESEYQVNGKIKLLELTGNPMEIENGKVCLCIGQNITDRKQAQEKIRHTEERYRRITEAVTDYFYTVTLKGGRVEKTFHGEACFAVTGYTIDEFSDNPYLWINIVPDKDRHLVLRQAEYVLSGHDPDSIEHRIVRKDGVERWVVSAVVPNRDPEGNLISYDGIVRDITENKIARKQMEYHAFYDQLTNLPNRALLKKHLDHEIKLASRHEHYVFAVLILDLDRFKVIVDSLGHAIGDHLLASVAKRLTACTRTGDTIARLGGDEFAMLLTDIKDASDATRAADRIKDELASTFTLNELEVFITASIGIAMNKPSYKQGDDILRDADTAMYRAKALGRARSVLFDDHMYVSVMNRLQLEADLRRAVIRREFFVHYQPVVSLPDRRITGAEALIRWQDPKGGMIPPAEFIPLAEETGLISAIGEWILGTACEQNKKWRDAGHNDLLVKVNFSAAQFYNQDILELVKRTLRETGMAADLLDIEITESVAMDDHSITVLKELSGLGARISIDDFGTGYSSLGSLKRLPINTIKIDRSFIRDITIDPNAQAIVRAIIAMAHNLNMRTLAEGVETKDQLEFLLANRCEEAQGYFFSPPVPEREFIKLLPPKLND